MASTTEVKKIQNKSSILSGKGTLIIDGQVLDIFYSNL